MTQPNHCLLTYTCGRWASEGGGFEEAWRDSSVDPPALLSGGGSARRFWLPPTSMMASRRHERIFGKLSCTFVRSGLDTWLVPRRVSSQLASLLNALENKTAKRYRIYWIVCSLLNRSRYQPRRVLLFGHSPIYRYFEFELVTLLPGTTLKSSGRFISF